MPIESALEAERQYRKRLDYRELSLAQFSAALRAIGYRFDRRMDCRAPARYLGGERAGESYLALSLYPVQCDNGMSAFHFQARRDGNYQALQAIRDSTFSVVKGAIAEF